MIQPWNVSKNVFGEAQNIILKKYIVTKTMPSKSYTTQTDSHM